MKKFLIPFLFAFFSGAVMAQGASASFDEVDSNADGDVSESELQAAGVDVDMQSADEDGDGTLSQEEYEKASSGATGSGAMGGSSPDYDPDSGDSGTDFGTESETTIP